MKIEPVLNPFKAFPCAQNASLLLNSACIAGLSAGLFFNSHFTTVTKIGHTFSDEWMDLPHAFKRFCPKEQAVCFRPSEEALNIAMSVFSGGGGGGGAPSFSSVLLGLTSLSLTSVLVYMLTSQVRIP